MQRHAGGGERLGVLAAVLLLVHEHEVGAELGHAVTDLSGPDLDAARAAARRAAGAPPVRWAYLIWRRPWMAVRDDTFVSALLDQAGGENVFAGADARYPVVTAAALGAADPDLVLLSSEPFPFADAHADELAAESGLPRGRFVLADGELLSWHGARTAEGVDYAAALLETVRAARDATAPRDATAAR